MWNADFLSHPLFLPLVSSAQYFSNYAEWPTLADYNQLLANRNLQTKSGQSLSCILQQKIKNKNFTDQYEPSVYLRGELLTRESNWHDFFNVMVWLTFPKTKAEINFQQYDALRQRLGISQNRNMLENVLTLFDENGAIILSCNEKLLQLLKDFQWHELFWQHRAEVLAEMRCYIFGHSIYEKMLNPYLGMTASTIIFLVSREFFSLELSEQLKFLDEKLYDFFKNGNIKVTKELLPLPLLGFPGWHKANEEEEYYNNIQYFRPKKHDKEVRKLIGAELK